MNSLIPFSLFKMIRRKLTRIELSLDDTKELEEYLKNLKQLQNETKTEITDLNSNAASAQQVKNEFKERMISYNPQPHDSSNRFQFNQSFIR